MIALFLAAAAIAALGFFVWTWRLMMREAQLDLAEFARRFPGRCMVCSYHRFGLHHGIVAPGTPVDPHHCVEGRSP